MHIKTILRGNQNTKQRADRAIQILLHGERRGWAFDNCFDMGDGGAVYREIIRRADHDKKIGAAIREQGHGFWFASEYRNKHDPQLKRF